MAVDFDILVYGATGFTGRRGAAYLVENAPEGVRIAVGGRRLSALESLAAELALPRERVVVADAGDAAAVDAMVARTRVVLSYAGPFAAYSPKIVDACVRFGVHYLDITGESAWVREVIDSYHERAKDGGTLVVPFVGFDSVPSDLGTLAAVRAVRRAFDEPTRRVWSFVAIKGGINGGTLETARRMASPEARRSLADPILLHPEEMRTKEERRHHRDVRPPVRDPITGRVGAAFFMASINTRVVRRSDALLREQGCGYGEGFDYQEFLSVGSSGGMLNARLKTAVTAAVFGALTTEAGRWLSRKLGPAPGEGPSEEAIESGFFRFDFVAEGASGRVVRTRFEAEGDPGNASTVLMAGQAALAALESQTKPGEGGVLTPSVAFGEAFLRRLVDAGISLGVSPVD